MTPGIDSISFYAPRYYLDLKELAQKRGVDFNKYYVGLGQEQMAVAPPDEDIVTMAASAAAPLVESDEIRGSIDTVLFATETGIDQSKAAGIYVHKLLSLPRSCRVVEIKQACYSATAALRLAGAFTAQNPQSRVLVLAADIARYGLGARGEPTQGCGAIAMIVSADPRVMQLEPEAGLCTEDVMDFWRPNYMDTALVDGHFSTKVYLASLVEAWEDYVRKSGRAFSDFTRFCYHLPFTKMAVKAHQRLARTAGVDMADDTEPGEQLADSLHYNRTTGNSYTASLYEGLASLLDTSARDLSGERIGLFSYGSGCVGEFFSGVLQHDYRSALRTQAHRDMFAQRTALTCGEYEEFYSFSIPQDGGEYAFPKNRTGPYRLAGISGHKRLYESVQ